VTPAIGEPTYNTLPGRPALSSGEDTLGENLQVRIRESL